MGHLRFEWAHVCATWGKRLHQCKPFGVPMILLFDGESDKQSVMDSCMFFFIELVCMERRNRIGVCNMIEMARGHCVGLWCIRNRGMAFGDLSSDFVS